MYDGREVSCVCGFQMTHEQAESAGLDLRPLTNSDEDLSNEKIMASIV